MARLQSDLILSLQDRVTAPMRRIDQSLDNMRRQQQRSEEMFNQHRNTMIATGVAAYALARSLSAPVQASTDYSTLLEDIRQTAGATQKEIEVLGKSYRQAGLDTAQGYEQIALANAAMIASGAVTKEQAAIMDDFAGRTATAYGADIVDIANTQVSIVQQLGVSAEDTAVALDRLSTAGKLGSFELVDMSSEYAATAAQAAVLKMAGVDAAGSIAAWLQIARKGKATGSEAATAMRGFMSSLVMPNTAKRFKADGVDIIGEISRAAAAGVDPIEHVVGILNKLTGGDSSKLTKYFREEGALSFATQATKRLEEYKAMMDEINSAQGTVQTDFNDRMKTPGAINARFWASMNELQLVIGDSLVPSLTKFVTEVTPMIDGLSGFVEANDELVAAMVQTAAALIALRLLASAGGMFSALTDMAGKSGALPLGGAPTGGVPTKGAGAPGAGNGFQQYMVLAPIIADQIGTAIWDKIYGEGDAAANKAIADGAWGRTAERLASLMPTQLDGGTLQDDIAALHVEIARVSGEIANTPAPAFDGAMDTAAPMRSVLADLERQLAEAEAKAAASGAMIGQSLEQGITAQSPAIAVQMQSVMDRLRVIAASGVTIPMRVNGPQVSPVVTRASIAGARARGGSVRGGSTYAINELGQEYFTPGVNGFVHKAGSFQPPSMPNFGANAGQGGNATPASIHFGDIILQNPTNATPRQIANELGVMVADRLRASHSNGGF